MNAPTLNRVDMLDCAAGHHDFSDDASECHVCGRTQAEASAPASNRDPWERRGTAIFTEGNGKPGGAQLVIELHGQCEAFTVQAIVDAHNRDAGFA